MKNIKYLSCSQTLSPKIDACLQTLNMYTALTLQIVKYKNKVLKQEHTEILPISNKSTLIPEVLFKTIWFVYLIAVPLIPI